MSCGSPEEVEGRFDVFRAGFRGGRAGAGPWRSSGSREGNGTGPGRPTVERLAVRFLRKMDFLENSDCSAAGELGTECGSGVDGLARSMVDGPGCAVFAG